MKKLSYLLIVMIVASSIFFVGCEKNSNDIVNKQTKSNKFAVEKSSKTYYWENVEKQVTANETNPLDYVGYEHNFALQEIEVECTPDMSYEDVILYMHDYFLNKSKYKKNISLMEDPILFIDNTIDSTVNALNNDRVYQYINKLKLDELEKNEMNNLLDIIFAYNVDNYSDVISSIKSFEKDIINKYDVENINVVLMASSVSRYSLAYWHNRLKNSNLSKKKGWWKKAAIAVGDVIGAVAGATAASETVVGAVAGAIVGAAATSKAVDTLIKVNGGEKN